MQSHMQQQQSTSGVRSDQRGFSLVEALLAVAVFGLVSSGVIGAFIYGQQSAQQGGQRQRAVMVAEQTVEIVRAIAVQDWYSVQDAVPGNYGLAQADGVWTLSGTSSTTGQFTQVVALADVCRNATTHVQEVCTESNRDYASREVTVTVTWTGAFHIQKTVTSTTIITNWGTQVWNQTDWSGGDGQATWSDATRYDSSEGSPDTETPGQLGAASGGVTNGPGCGVKTYDMSTASEYSASSSDITISGGTSALTQYGTAVDANTVGLWHLNESASPIVDYSGRNNNLTQSGNAFVYGAAGKFGTSVGSGDGLNDYWQIPDASQSGLESFSAFTLEAWYKTGSSVNAGIDVIVSKYGSTAATRSYMLQWNNGVNGSANLQFGIGNGTSDLVLTSSQFGISANTWYHLAAVYDGANMRIYLNGTNIGSRTYGGTTANTTLPFFLGGNSTTGANSLAVGARLDEVRISNVSRYNANFSVPTGPYGLYYASTSPTLQPTENYDPVAVGRWQSFSETATKAGTGEIYYQLSDDNGATWKYWNGSAWATASTATNYNTASVVNTNIGTFPITNTQLKWRAFFVSNGVDAISLDSITVTCVMTHNWDFSNAAAYSAETGSTVTGGEAVLNTTGTAVDANTVGLWHLDEPSGTLQDYTSNNNDLTTLNGGFLYGQGGKFNSSLAFGSTSQYVGIANNLDGSTLDPSGSFTVDFWVYKTSFSSLDTLVRRSYNTAASTSYDIWVRNDRLVQVDISRGDSTIASAISSTQLPQNTWTHIAVTFNSYGAVNGSGYGSSLDLYMGGVNVASRQQIFTNVYSGNADFVVSDNGADSMQGRIDELRVSNIARWTGTTGFTPDTSPYGLNYNTTQPRVQNTTAPTLINPSAWYGLAETATTFNQSTITYQLSNNGTDWYYWNGSAWAAAAAKQGSSATTVNSNIATFPATGGNIYFRAILTSNGTDVASINNLELQYVQDPVNGGVIEGAGGGSGTATITSSAFDMGSATNFTRIEWDEGDPPCVEGECSVRLQVRTAPDNGGVPGTWTGWYGATGLDTYFTDGTGQTEVPPEEVQGNRWVQYRANLDGTGGGTPVLEDVRLFYD